MTFHVEIWGEVFVKAVKWYRKATVISIPHYIQVFASEEAVFASRASVVWSRGYDAPPDKASK